MMLLFSPPLRFSGVSGMRGVTADQVFLFVLVLTLFFVQTNGFLKALATLLDRRRFLGFWFVFLLVIGIFCAALRMLFDAASEGPLIEVARIYGFVRPAFIFLLTAVLLQIKSERDGGISLRFLNRVIVSVGFVPVMCGALQGIGYEPVSDFLVANYTRDVDFDDVITYGRAYSFFDGQPNTYGTFCAFYLLLVLGLIRGLLSLILALPLIVVSCFGLLVSGSRGALLSLLIVGAVWIVSRRNWMALWAIGLTLMCSLVAVNFAGEFVPPMILDRLADALGFGGQGSVGLVTSRLPYWGTVISLLSEMPQRMIWGVPGLLMPPADNLQLALIGLFGFVGMAIFMMIVMVMIWKLFRHRDPETQALLVFAVLMLFNGISYPTFFSARISDLYWLFAGIFFFYPQTKLRNANTASYPQSI